MIFDAQLFRALDGSHEIVVSLIRPESDHGLNICQMDVPQCQLHVTACADSLVTFETLAGDLRNLAPPAEG